MKAKKRGKPSGPTNKSRKQIRKDMRKQKKARRHEYYTNRNKTGKPVPNSDKLQPHIPPPVRPDKIVAKPRNTQKVLTAEEQQRKTLLKERREHEKLKKEMAKQRKEQLQKANDDEDRNIKRLEKQLHLNKRKSKSTPKSFTEDGLDYLLEVCDSNNMKAAVAAEQHLAEVNEGFEEDFALMTGKTLKKRKRNSDIDLDDSDVDNEENGDDEEYTSDIDINQDSESEMEFSDEEEIIKTSAKGNKIQKQLKNDLTNARTKTEPSSSNSEDETDANNVSEEVVDFSDEEEVGKTSIKGRKIQKQARKVLTNKRKKTESWSSNVQDETDDELDANDDREEVNFSDEEDVVNTSTNSNKIRKQNRNGPMNKKKKIESSPSDNSEDETDSHEDIEEEINRSDEEIFEFDTTDKNTNKVKNVVTKRKKIESSSSINNDEDSDSFNDNSDDDNEENTDIDEPQVKSDKEVWEDIYGRLRGKDGSVITENQGKYIPPAVRAKMEAESSLDKKRGEKLNRLKRQLKGLLNRLAESNMHNIASQVEDLYMNNSRNDMNDTLTSLIFDSIITPILTPERLLLEHVMLVTILHANVGTEVGAHFLQSVVRKFDALYKAEHPVENKMLDNVVWIVAQLYNYKVFHVQLIYEILNKLSSRFTEADIECILLILKSVGFSMRKDDPIALKTLILSLQKQANNACAEMKENLRVKFMLDILLAVKNNNMSKIPNYDTSYSEHLKKLLKGFLHKGSYVTTLNISLEDLLKADECGKWWVVGSAWTGKTTESDQNKGSSDKLEGFSQKLLDLARKQRMNTDTRRNIFCIIMSAEDYLDAFEKLLHLGLKNQQEREIVHVILHCCLQEKKFNPYYAVLAQKFCEYDRKFQMTIKYSVWDKLKAITECSATQLSNLAKLLTHLFLEKGLPISTLKIVQFGELDKITLRFMRQILIGILLCEDLEVCQVVFTNIAQSDKLKMFRESLKLFIQHFLLRNLKSEGIPQEQTALLEDRAKMVDKILSIGDKKVRF